MNMFKTKTKTNADIFEFLRLHVKSCGEFHDETLKQVLDAVESIITNDIQGDFVEIGVYKGVMVMAMCAKLIQLGVTDRIVHLYDTFEGMVDPSDKDVYCYNNSLPDVNNESVKSYCPLSQVKANILLTGYPVSNIVYHVGDICQTDLNMIPSAISLLRLDTDWYDSTKFELDNFTKNVSDKGIITQDDYNWWKGATDAVNEYLQGQPAVDVNMLHPHGIWWVHSIKNY